MLIVVLVVIVHPESASEELVPVELMEMHADLEMIVPLDIALLHQAHVLLHLFWILVMVLLAQTTENVRVMESASVKIHSSKPIIGKIVNVQMEAS